MKGIVFTELLEMIEQNHGYETVDTILSSLELESGGIYTAIGSYPHQELQQIVMTCSKLINQPPNLLIHHFGKHLFAVFLKNYPAFFEQHKTAFSFLQSIDNHIHVEVLKLYPDAELPKFHLELSADQKVLKMRYLSSRGLHNLAEGLIESTMEHFSEKFEISKIKNTDIGTDVLFTISII